MSSRNGLEERISYEPLRCHLQYLCMELSLFGRCKCFYTRIDCGNAVMYKPSEYSALTGLQIEKLLKQAGVPENVFHIAIGAKNVGELLLDLPFDGYYFTGSYKTGKYIYEKVAPKMVPCQCELGGKDPLYVADDVKDIKAAAVATADGAFIITGKAAVLWREFT